MGTKMETVFFILTHLGHRDTGTKGAQEVHERGTRGALTGTKMETVFFILTHLGHRDNWHQRCTRGARKVHERCTHGH